jgi:hypothetical protein
MYDTDLWHQMHYGPCRAKPTVGQLCMGDFYLTQAVVPGWERQKYWVAADTDDAFASSTDCDATNPQYLKLGYMKEGSYPYTYTHYDSYFRWSLPIPVGSVVTRASLGFYRMATETESVWARVYLLDRDSMNAFSEVASHADNPARDNPNGPGRMNVLDDNLVEIEAGDALANVYLDGLAPLVQAFIDRPGYAANNYIGVSLQGEQSLNTSEDAHVLPTSYPYQTDGDYAAILYVSWREPGSSETGDYSTPPRLGARLHIKQNLTSIPDTGSWPEYGTTWDAGWNVLDDYSDKSKLATHVPDKPWAAAYKYGMLLGVDPLLTWWNETDYGPAPYPAGAHELFPLQDCETYLVPCRKTVHPWIYNSDEASANIPSGLPAITFFSSGPSLHGSLPIYAMVYDGAVAYTSTDENSWRIYRGATRPARKEWTTDPHSRGWYIVYQAFVKAWFAQDSYWQGFCLPPGVAGSVGEPDICTFRWNAWYTVDLKCTVVGDETDLSFRAWILSHHGGFGGTVTPRYSHCCDVLAGCGGNRNAGTTLAMGDTIFPPAATQDTGEPSGWTHDGVTVYPPCLHADAGYGYWYMPEYTSNHVKSPLTGDRIGAYPEYGLYHQTKFVRKSDPDGTETSDVFGWAILVFQSNTPRLVSAGEGVDPADYVNEIQQITITPPAGTSGAPGYGVIVVGFYDDEASHSEDIGYSTTEANIPGKLDNVTLIGSASNVTVTGCIADGSITIEFVGDLARKNMPPLQVFLNTLKKLSGSTEYYTVTVTTIQDGLIPLGTS